jgi:hypothetical protein
VDSEEQRGIPIPARLDRAAQEEREYVVRIEVPASGLDPLEAAASGIQLLLEGDGDWMVQVIPGELEGDPYAMHHGATVVLVSDQGEARYAYEEDASGQA